MMRLPYPGTRRKALPVLLFLTSAPFVVAGAWLAARAFGPSQIPANPTLFGMVSGPVSPDSVALKSLALTTVVVGMTWILFLAGVWKGRYTWVSWTIFLVWIDAGMSISTLIGAVAADSYEAAASRIWPFFLTSALFLIAGTVATVSRRAPRPTTSRRPLPQSSLQLAVSERAVFAGSATSTSKLVLGLALALTGVGLMTESQWFALMVIYGLLWANASVVWVMIDDSGVRVRPRWIRWSMQRTPLAEVASARVTRHFTAWQEFERIDDEKRDAVSTVRIRPGDALELVLHDGKTQSVSLDHAEQAADVLNALIVRLRSDKDPSKAVS